jgi:glutamate dehydrogenase (NAD(P)+)
MVGATVAVQGAGKVGAVAALLLLFQAGCRVVAIGDHTAARYDAKGLNVEEVVQWLASHGTLEGYARGEPIDNAVLLELDVDVLVPAALENVITSANAHRIRALIVCEGANGPTTARADAILDRNGVFIIPDILANAGGVTVSYFEWVQNRMGYYWTETHVNEQLTAIMKRGFAEVLRMAARHRVSLRVAAYTLGVERVAVAQRLRGLYA